MIKTANSLQPLKSCPVRRVALSDIRKWLAQGWGDIQANPWSSLLYGIIFAAVGLFVSLFLADNPGFFMATAASFLLLAACRTPRFPNKVYNQRTQRTTG